MFRFVYTYMQVGSSRDKCKGVKNRARNDLLMWLGLLSVTPTI